MPVDSAEVQVLPAAVWLSMVTPTLPVAETIDMKSIPPITLAITLVFIPAVNPLDSESALTASMLKVSKDLSLPVWALASPT